MKFPSVVASSASLLVGILVDEPETFVEAFRSSISSPSSSIEAATATIDEMTSVNVISTQTTDDIATVVSVVHNDDIWTEDTV